jgi:tRNA modification GTPase
MVCISAKEGAGIDTLKQQVLKCAGVQQKESSGAYLARRRHLDALERALNLLIIGQSKLSEHNAGELLAEDLKYAHLALCEITGEYSADDLLGQIFSSFCIGK